jgi:hypothetical protein
MGGAILLSLNSFEVNACRQLLNSWNSAFDRAFYNIAAKVAGS